MVEPLTFLADLLALGQSPDQMGYANVLARAVVVYTAGYLIVRTIKARFLGKNSVFDVVLGFILGSMLSRAINGQAPLFETIVGGALLVALHEALSAIGARWHGFSQLTKGEARELVREGEADWEEVRRQRLSPQDLEEHLRMHGGVSRVEDVSSARLERNGAVSVIPRRRERVVDVQVAAGVQTVRIVLDD
jgi:uncharacterized membrane protein YcaP (DUF421 family)